MKLFNGIIGVLSIFGALYCIAWGDASFLHYGWIVTLILLLTAISNIFTYVINRKVIKEKGGNTLAIGLAGLVLGIIVCVLSVMAIFNPLVQASFLLLVYLIFTVFMLISGIVVIVFANKIKKSEEPKGWGVTLFSGIIVLLIGVGALISCLAFDVLTGTSMGVMLGVYGIALIVSLFGSGGKSIYDEV